MNSIRKLPPVCLCIALARLISGHIRPSSQYLGASIASTEGERFIVFRHIVNSSHGLLPEACVFAVSFKFARLSHKANRLASIIPMLVIAGFPGFVQKLYAWNPENGHWLGMYEWKSNRHLNAYKRSFVFRMMNKRAIKGTVNCRVPIYSHLSDYLTEEQMSVTN